MPIDRSRLETSCYLVVEHPASLIWYMAFPCVIYHNTKILTMSMCSDLGRTILQYVIRGEKPWTVLIPSSQVSPLPLDSTNQIPAEKGRKKWISPLEINTLPHKVPLSKSSNPCYSSRGADLPEEQRKEKTNETVSLKRWSGEKIPVWSRNDKLALKPD